MPHTFNGCGTRFVGSRDRGPDGSYITTNWISFIYVPLIPLASYRVLPTGKSTNVVVHRSQEYLTKRVPLCWPQVRNVYVVVGPILLVVLYFSWPSIKDAFRHDAPTPAIAPTSHLQEKPFDPKTTNVAFETIHPARDKSRTDGPCGKVLKLDEKGFERLDLVKTLRKLVDEAGFTQEDFQGLSRSETEDLAFKAYGFAYLSWDKDGNGESDFRQTMEKSLSNLSPKSASDLIAIETYKSMMLRAHDLGLYDANRNPCPF
jgi:hypothetical protein